MILKINGGLICGEKECIPVQHQVNEVLKLPLGEQVVTNICHVVMIATAIPMAVAMSNNHQDQGVMGIKDLVVTGYKDIGYILTDTILTDTHQTYFQMIISAIGS